MTILLAIIGIAFGVFMFVYGEYDDSPGGQLLGVVSVVASIVGFIRSKNKNTDKQP